MIDLIRTASFTLEKRRRSYDLGIKRARRRDVHDLTDRRFLHLVVQRLAPLTATAHQNASWVCLCDCGSTITVRGDHLLDGTTKSCGCYRREVAPFKKKST